jgi:hypothetical protein
MIEHVLAVEVEHVEEPHAQRQPLLRLLEAVLAAEALHGLLEGPRPSRGVQRDRLTVEDDRADRQGERRLDDLGDPVR